MFKILFNRYSLVVRLMELIGVINSIIYLWNFEAAYLYLFLLLTYLFVRTCALVRWYPNGERPKMGVKHIGIEVHFVKALVPTSYILAVTSTFCLLDIPYLTTGIVIFADLLMLIVAPVNGIQIYFHLKDKDPFPINYFSLNKYLGEDTALPPNPSSVETGMYRSLRLTGRIESDPVNTRSL